MTFEIAMVELEGFGFPLRYPEAVVNSIDNLNQEVNKRRPTGVDFERSGRAISRTVQHSMHPITSDDYTWLYRLDFLMRGIRVDDGCALRDRLGYAIRGIRFALLVPWQDVNHPRLINLYVEGEVMPHPKKVVDFLDRLTYRVALNPIKRHP